MASSTPSRPGDHGAADGRPGAARRGGGRGVDVGAADPGGRRPDAGHRLLAQRAGAAGARRVRVVRRPRGRAARGGPRPAGAPAVAAGRRVPRRPLRHLGPEPVVHVGRLVGGARGHPAGVGGADRPAAGRPRAPAAVVGDRHRRWRAPSCSPASTCRSPPGRCSATCWRWPAGCWPRPTSRWAPRSAAPSRRPCTRTVCYGVAAVALLAVCLPAASRSPATTDGRGWAAGRHRGRPAAARAHRRQPGAEHDEPDAGVGGDPVRDRGGGLLAWLAFDEVPPASAIPAGVLIAAGVVLVVRANPAEPAVAGSPPIE